MSPDTSIFKRYARALKPIPTQATPKLEGLRTYQAVLFDVYGTLLISGAGEIGRGCASTLQREQLRQLLRRYAIGVSPEHLKRAFEEAVQASHTASRQEGVDYPEVDIVQIWQHVLGVADLAWIAEFALEYELLTNPVDPMPGVNDLLNAIRAADISMGLISNAQCYTTFVLEGLLGRSLANCGFNRHLLFYSWMEGHAKPSRVMFERARSALREMAIPAASVLYVGNDMRNDIVPAASVGFNTALFAGDQRSLRLRESDADCRHVTPDVIVTDLRQLIVGIDENTT
jgi:putative hydrolase of the HAD superfamily